MFLYGANMHADQPHVIGPCKIPKEYQFEILSQNLKNNSAALFAIQ